MIIDPFTLIDQIDSMKIAKRNDFWNFLELYKKPIGIVVGGLNSSFEETLLKRARTDLFLYIVQKESNAFIESMKSKMLSNNLYRDCIKIIMKTSQEASLLFADNFFDFIYLEAGRVEKEVKKELELWWPKAKDCCLFSGNGYLYKKNRNGVNKAANSFFKENRQELFLTQEKGKTEEEKLRSFYVFKNMAP